MRHVLPTLFISAALALPHAAAARVSFAVGDFVFADGQTFTYEEYEEYKKTHPADAPKVPPQQQQQQQLQYQAEPVYASPPQYQAPPSATVVNGQPVVTVAPPPVAAPLPLQTTVGNAAAQPYPTYAAAPAARTSPSLRAASCRTVRTYAEFPGDGERFDCGAAGQLSRPEMLAQGWKIDFIEKLPSGQGGLSAYKIVLSR